MNLIKEDKRVIRERRVNNEIYRKVKSELRDYKGKYILIAKGKFLGVASDFHEAIKNLKSKAPDAKHAIVKKVGRIIEVEREWPGILERLK